MLNWELMRGYESKPIHMTTIRSNKAHRSTEKGSGQNKVPEKHPFAMPNPKKSSRHSNSGVERRNGKTHRIGCGYTVG